MKQQSGISVQGYHDVFSLLLLFLVREIWQAIVLTTVKCCYEIKRVRKHVLWLISECILLYSLEPNRRGGPAVIFTNERVFSPLINRRYRFETTKPTTHISFEGLFFLCRMCFAVIFFIS
jgi:hypothetical protein